LVEWLSKLNSLNGSRADPAWGREIDRRLVAGSRIVEHWIGGVHGWNHGEKPKHEWMRIFNQSW